MVCGVTFKEYSAAGRREAMQKKTSARRCMSYLCTSVCPGRGGLRSCSNNEMAAMAKVNPFLMFEGKAEEAMNFYVSLFPASEVVDVVRYGPGQAGPEGSII